MISLLLNPAPLHFIAHKAGRVGLTRENSGHVIGLLRTWPISLSVGGPTWSVPLASLQLHLWHACPHPLWSSHNGLLLSPDMPSTLSPPFWMLFLELAAMVLHKCFRFYTNAPQLRLPLALFSFSLFEFSLQSLFLSNILYILLMFSI